MFSSPAPQFEARAWCANMFETTGDESFEWDDAAWCELSRASGGDGVVRRDAVLTLAKRRREDASYAAATNREVFALGPCGERLEIHASADEELIASAEDGDSNVRARACARPRPAA